MYCVEMQLYSASVAVFCSGSEKKNKAQLEYTPQWWQ